MLVLSAHKLEKRHEKSNEPLQGQETMLYLVHRVTIGIKLRPIKLEQAVSESLPHKGLYIELLGVQLTCLDPVPASIRVRSAQEINITNCDVTTWSCVNLVHPLINNSIKTNQF